jgi:sterol desaturase/sphingolipid hydroxylase (fatty acid hydroxylase superfamily)
MGTFTNVYVCVQGITGVLDHSGINIALFGIYDTKDHDGHHQHFNVNYGFPFPWFDLLHGTFDGTFCGVRIRPAYKMASEIPSKISNMYMDVEAEGHQGDSTASMAQQHKENPKEE